MFKNNQGIFLPDSFNKAESPRPDPKAPIVLRKAGLPVPALASKMNADPFRTSWQLSYLRNAAAYEWCAKNMPWVRIALETVVSSCVMDQYSIETEDDDLRHAMEVFLYNINFDKSFDKLLRTVYKDMLVCGNWYGRIFYKGNAPVGIERIKYTQIVPDLPEDGTNRIKSYSIYPAGPQGGASMQIPSVQILHFTLNEDGDNGTGLSLLESLDMTIALERFATEYQTGFFTNGVKAGDVYASGGTMSPETYERDKIYLEAYTAVDRSYAPIFLSGDWNLIARGQELRKDADFLALRNWNREEILSIFQIPMSLVSTDKVGTLGSNGKAEDRELFLNTTVAPLQKQVFEDFNRQFVVGRLRNEQIRLLPPGRPRVRLGDLQAAELMVKVGFTGNEIRSALNLDLVEGLDETIYVMPGGAIIGIPGSPDSIYLTRMGPISGAPVALPDEIRADQGIVDPLQSGNEFAQLKNRVVNNPSYQAAKQQAGNQPTANTRSQSNDAYGTPGASPGGKQNIVTNPAASATGNIPNNRGVNNRSTKPVLPRPQSNNVPPSTKKKKKPEPKGRLKRKVNPN